MANMGKVCFLLNDVNKAISFMRTFGEFVLVDPNLKNLDWTTQFSSHLNGPCILAANCDNITPFAVKRFLAGLDDLADWGIYKVFVVDMVYGDVWEEI